MPRLGHAIRVTPSYVIRIFGGVARWNEIGCLVTRAQVDAALAAGTITRLRRGTYALGDLAEVRAVAQARAATVSHLSAALDHGWKVTWPPEQPTPPCRAIDRVPGSKGSRSTGRTSARCKSTAASRGRWRRSSGVPGRTHSTSPCASRTPRSGSGP